MDANPCEGIEGPLAKAMRLALPSQVYRLFVSPAIIACMRLSRSAKLMWRTEDAVEEPDELEAERDGEAEEEDDDGEDNNEDDDDDDEDFEELFLFLFFEVVVGIPTPLFFAAIRAFLLLNLTSRSGVGDLTLPRGARSSLSLSDWTVTFTLPKSFEKFLSHHPSVGPAR